MKNDSTPLEVKNDDVNRPETRPPSAYVETRPLILSLTKKEVVQKTKEEEEAAQLWDELERSLREMEAESMIEKFETTHDNLGNPSTSCKHDLRLDEEIGVYCRLCRWVKTEIQYVSEQNADPQCEGGCIISHASGTGKTRLTIVFLGAYLKVFPKCLPIIVAPASLLLTWEEEFKKWDIGVPFHNLSNLELSGKEHVDALNLLSRSNRKT
ncbi:hypothetical protein RYX36_029380 [Vicia faba]